MPRPISAGVLGIARTTRGAAAGARDRVAADAGHHADSCSAPPTKAAQGAAASAKQLRLDGPDHQSRAPASARRRRPAPHAEGLRAARARCASQRLDDDDRAGRPAAAHQAADQMAPAMLPPPMKAMLLLPCAAV